jgi:hypothetical protein
MNATAAIADSLLHKNTLSIRDAFVFFGVTNLPREIGRSIERKFGVKVKRTHRSGKTRYRQPCSWMEYSLPLYAKKNQKGIRKMRAYVKAQKKIKTR